VSNLTSRILVAAVGIPVLIGCIVNGGVLLQTLIVILQLAVVWEWTKFAKSANVSLSVWNLLLPLTAVDVLIFASGEPLSSVVALLIVFFWILLNVFDKSRTPLRTLGHGVLYAVYAALPLALWFPISEFSNTTRFSSIGALFLLFAATWLCDSAAYFGGRALGKHKLYVAASPNKTIEGALFGVLGAALLLPFARLLNFASPDRLDYLVLPLIVGLAGQAGDLIESLMKREVGVKDSSSLIPGHGGVLDRFDSLLLSSPFYFAYLYLTS
jgi:phosphatidate cytidylyltransferase